MDYARKIGKSDEPKKWVEEPPSFVTAYDEPICADVYFFEDNRLVNWKKWLERRKKQYEHTKSATNRHPDDQVLNSCEKVRPLIEMRNLIDYASVPVPLIPDKYRGGPEFWRTPQTLPKRSCLPDIAFTANKKELNITPELTYVGLPELIEKEKHLTGLKLKEPLWKRSDYLIKRKKDLSKQIESLILREPETKNLVIKNYTSPKREVLPRIPPITIFHTEEGKKGKEREPCWEYYPEQVVVMKIQDCEIGWQTFILNNNRENAHPVMWSLTFSGKINERNEKEIVFENKGNRVIVYQWRIAMFRSNAISLSRKMSSIFFNKTKGVILPGKIIKLKVWYQPRNSHVSTEFWELITSPVLCSSPLIFRFWGCAETAIQLPKINSTVIVDEYLDRCIRDTTIREIINDIVDSISSIKHLKPAYSTLFPQSEVFTLKNPLCFYNSSLLIEFQKMYLNTTNQKKQHWNMSLNDLRETLLQMKPPEHRNLILLQFSMLYKECLNPILYTFIQYNKYEMVYNLLCSFFNLFEAESEFAKKVCFAKKCKEISDMTSEENCIISMNISQVSLKSQSSQSKRRQKYGFFSQNNQLHRNTEISIFSTNDCAYKEIFFIRIYYLLGEILLRVFAAIESFNNLNECDK